MPFYPQLRIRPNDSQAVKTKKARVANRLKDLKNALHLHFQQASLATRDLENKNQESVKIATWNIRDFGAGKFKGRDYEPLYYIAEIISHFDIVALQEVRGDLEEFKKLLRILGPDWEYIATDVTDGGPGNGERMVFLYDIRTTSFRNIAGELTLKEGNKIRAAFGERIRLEQGDIRINLPAGTPGLSGTYDARLRSASGGKKLDADLEIPLPPGSTLEIPEGSRLVVTKNTPVESPGRGKATVTIPDEIKGESFRLRLPDQSFDDSLRQFARTPFLISFQSGWLKLNLCTVHIFYGDASDESLLEQRRKEIELLCESLAKKAKGEFKHDGSSFLGVLGDFNIIGRGHPTMEALESNGFQIPEALKSIPGSNVARDKAYDQIAFWEPRQNRGVVHLDIMSADIFDFFQHVFTKEDEDIYRAESDNGLKPNSKYTTWRTYKMSDHLPMWIELRKDFSQEYLDEILKDEQS